MAGANPRDSADRNPYGVIMPEDDYQYQPKPLPQVTPFGGTQSSSAGSAPTTPATIDIADNLLTNSPFNNDAGQGSYPGAGGGALEYITDAANLVVGVGPSGSSTRTTVNTGATGDNLVLLDSAGSSGGLATLLVGANIFQLAVDDYNAITDITGVVQLRSLDVCHMGAPGLRGFVCSESWAAP